MPSSYLRPGVFVNTSLTPLATSTSGIPGEATPAFALGFNRGPVTPTLITSWQQFKLLYGDFPVANGSLLTYAVYQFFNNGGSACFVLRVPNSDAVTASTLLDGVGGDASTSILTVQATSPGVWGNGVYVEVTSAGTPGRSNINVYSGGNAPANLVESFVDLSMNPADPRNVAALINSPVSGSSNIVVTETLGGSYVAGTTDLAVITPTPLASGSDGTIAPQLATTVPTQLDTLPNQVLNLNLPGWTSVSDINTIISWAAGRGDVFVIVDGPTPSFPIASTAAVAQNYINMVQGSGVLSAAANACVYAPFLSIVDPASAVPGATRWVPPGGAVLGVWSATDNAHGIQKTPAGINANVEAVQLEANFTTTDLNNLNQAQVNAIKVVPGSGICVFGGRTLQPGYPSRYISVERTLMQFIHDFTFLTQFAIFEPNDANLWLQITSILTNYLSQQMQAGVLAGNTPATAFAVTCDATNNTVSSAQTGLVNVSVAVALTSPAEFIVINLSQFQGQTTATVTS